MSFKICQRENNQSFSFRNTPIPFMIVTIITFAIAASIGLTMILKVFQNKKPLKAVAISQGMFGLHLWFFSAGFYQKSRHECDIADFLFDSSISRFFYVL